MANESQITSRIIISGNIKIFVQDRFIWLDDTTVAVSPVGAGGRAAFGLFGIELAPLQMPLSFSPYVFAFLPEATYKRLPALLADALPDDFGNNLVDAWQRYCD